MSGFRAGNIAGGNYSEIRNAGEINCVSGGRVWRDINIGAVFLGRGASAPDLVQVNGGTIYLPGFNGNVTTEQLYGCIEIDHFVAQNTVIYPHVHWMPVNANAGNVTWNLTYTLQEPDAAYPAEATLVSTAAAPGVAWQQVFTDIGAGITIAHIGAQLNFCFWRDPTLVTDTYGSDAVVQTIGFHVLVDTMGSREILIK